MLSSSSYSASHSRLPCLIVCIVTFLLFSMCVHNHSSLKVPSSLNAGFDKCEYVDYSETFDFNINDTELKVLQYNIRGLVNEQSELEELLNNCCRDKIHVAILNEMWLNTENVNRISMPGYTYHGDERTNKKGGGVGFLISKSIKFRTPSNKTS